MVLSCDIFEVFVVLQWKLSAAIAPCGPDVTHSHREHPISIPTRMFLFLYTTTLLSGSGFRTVAASSRSKSHALKHLPTFDRRGYRVEHTLL